MHSHRNAYHIGYEDEPTVAVRLVGNIFPFEDEPEHESGAERREGIHLALNRREPECVAPGVNKRATHTAAHNNEILDKRQVGGIVFNHKTLHQVGNGPEKQEDCAGAQQSRHSIDTDSHSARTRGKIDEKPCRKHENRVARRVSHFQFVTLGYKLTAVPKTGCRLDGEKIGYRCNDKHQPPHRVVDNVVFSHFMCINTIISSCKVNAKRQ